MLEFLAKCGLKEVVKIYLCLGEELLAEVKTTIYGIRYVEVKGCGFRLFENGKSEGFVARWEIYDGENKNTKRCG